MARDSPPRLNRDRRIFTLPRKISSRIMVKSFGPRVLNNPNVTLDLALKPFQRLNASPSSIEPSSKMSICQAARKVSYSRSKSNSLSHKKSQGKDSQSKPLEQYFGLCNISTSSSKMDKSSDNRYTSNSSHSEGSPEIESRPKPNHEFEFGSPINTCPRNNVYDPASIASTHYIKTPPKMIVSPSTKHEYDLVTPKASSPDVSVTNSQPKPRGTPEIDPKEFYFTPPSKTYSRKSTSSSPIVISRPKFVSSSMVASSSKAPSIVKDQVRVIDLVSDDEEEIEELDELVCSITAKPASAKKSRDTLNVGERINDDIVHFYMEHLMMRATQEARRTVHVFNCFFYPKFKDMFISSLKKKLDESTIIEEVRRWDKDVKILDKHFLVIPVCEKNHWILIIVAYPGSVPPDTEFKTNSGRKPAVMIFDSLRFKYMTKFSGFIRSIFLKYRWRLEKPRDLPRDFNDRESLPERRAKVPKQTNTTDCGMHLLYSFQKFLENPLRTYKKVIDNQDLSSEFETDITRMRKQVQSLIPE